MHIIQGMHDGKSVTSQLKALGIPGIQFHHAVHADTALAGEYALAREARGDALADEIVDIADNTLDPIHARNRIDARKWYASKMLPQVYGDRLELNVTHTVDIGGALAEAHKRVSAASVAGQHNPKMPRSRKVLEIPSTQLVEKIEQDASEKPGGSESLEDIFS